MLQYQSTICQLFSTFGPVAALKYDKLFRCTKDQTLRWDNLKEGLLQTSLFPRQSAPAPPGGTGAMQQLLPQWLSPMQLARRCATVSMLEGAIGPLSQAAEGLTLADPANTCPRTPPVATCMHELQQAMQDSLGCCQRRLYPCSLDTRRFPRRTARAVRAARYGDQPRFQAAGDGVPSMAYIRGGRAAQHLGGCAKSQICQLIGGIERLCPLWIGPYCTPVMLVSTDETAVRQTTQVPQLQQPLVQVELCASSEAVYCHLTSEGATGQTATTDIYKCSIMRAPAVDRRGFWKQYIRSRSLRHSAVSMSWLPELVELYDTVINLASTHKQASHLPHSILPMVVPKAPSQWQAYAGAVLRAGLRRSSARCLRVAAPLLTSSHLALQQPLMPLQQPLEATSLQCHSWPQQGTPGQHHPVHSDHLGQMTLAGSGTPLA
eukprot:Em0059g6a